MSVNVLDYGDPTQAADMFEAACADAPRGSRIDVPAGRYEFDRAAVIPTGYHIVAEAPQSARCDALTRACFRIKEGFEPVTLYGLEMHGGGVQFEGNSRKGNVIEGCGFFSADKGIETLGQSVVGVTVRRCTFDECVWGAYIAYPQSDLWLFDECRFLRVIHVGIQTRSTGTDVHRCNFQGHPDGGGHAYIFVEGYSASSRGRIRIENNRFGQERVPPRCNIQLGPLVDDPDRSITDVLIRGNHFLGRHAESVEGDSGMHAIEVHAPLGRTSVVQNHIPGVYFGTVLAEKYAGGNTPGVQCAWRDNPMRLAENELQLGSHWSAG